MSRWQSVGEAFRPFVDRLNEASEGALSDGWELTGKERRQVRQTTEELRVFQIMFSVFFTLGLVEVSKAMLDYTGLNFRFSWAGMIHGIAALAVVLLGVRFFFAIEELSRYIICREETPGKLRKWKWTIPLFHYPMLLVHAYLYYSLCVIFKDMDPQSREAAGQLLFGRQFVDTFCAILILNVLWLFVVARPMWHRAKRYLTRETTWMVNNLTFAILALYAIGISQDTKVGESEFIAASVILLLNSVIDLAITAKHYVPDVADIA